MSRTSKIHPNSGPAGYHDEPALEHEKKNTKKYEDEVDLSTPKSKTRGKKSRGFFSKILRTTNKLTQYGSDKILKRPGHDQTMELPSNVAASKIPPSLPPKENDLSKSVNTELNRRSMFGSTGNSRRETFFLAGPESPSISGGKEVDEFGFVPPPSGDYETPSPVERNFTQEERPSISNGSLLDSYLGPEVPTKEPSEKTKSKRKYRKSKFPEQLIRNDDLQQSNDTTAMNEHSIASHHTDAGDSAKRRHVESVMYLDQDVLNMINQFQNSQMFSEMDTDISNPAPPEEMLPAPVEKESPQLPSLPVTIVDSLRLTQSRVVNGGALKKKDSQSHCRNRVQFSGMDEIIPDSNSENRDTTCSRTNFYEAPSEHLLIGSQSTAISLQQEDDIYNDSYYEDSSGISELQNMIEQLMTDGADGEFGHTGITEVQQDIDDGSRNISNFTNRPNINDREKLDNLKLVNHPVYNRPKVSSPLKKSAQPRASLETEISQSKRIQPVSNGNMPNLKIPDTLNMDVLVGGRNNSTIANGLEYSQENPEIIHMPITPPPSLPPKDNQGGKSIIKANEMDLRKNSEPLKTKKVKRRHVQIQARPVQTVSVGCQTDISMM